MVDGAGVKGLEKLTPIRLAEVLTQKGLIEPDAIADALYSHDRYREPFTDILIAAGHITEWDLAKIVVEHFQLPFIMSGSYDVADAVKTKLPTETLFYNLLVPLDVFDTTMLVAMPILVPFEVLQTIQRENKIILYPYVALPSENRTVLGEMYPDFKDWYTKSQIEIEGRRKVKAPKTGENQDDWTQLFDSADAAVRGNLKKG